MRALIIGLGLAGAMLAGPVALDNPTATAATASGIVAVDEPGVPPGPDPTPNIHGPGDPGPGQPLPPERRRHIDGDPMIER